jgi:hypothetical protein
VGDPPKLLDRIRGAARLRHFSRRTEKAYVAWAWRFILFHAKRHPADMGAEEITAFLSSLATVRKVSASTQNQALAAIVFLYRAVLERDVPWLDDLVRAKRPGRLPVVMSRAEVEAVLSELRGMPQLMAVLLYGAGLRLLECARLRIKDVDFDRCQLVVRAGKGDRDRVSVLPPSPATLFVAISSAWRACTARTLPAMRAWSSCRSPSPASTRAPDAIGHGSGSSRPPVRIGMPRPARSADTICTSQSSNAPCAPLAPGSPSASAVTRFGTRSRRISSRTATTSGPSRPCSAIATSAPP